jgi:hypothetical protein
MKAHPKLALGLALLALALVPAAGLASGQEGKSEPPTHNPKGHGYGYYCKGESKKHVKGQKGTPFNQCVRAAARADHNEKLTARQACKALTKKHVKGQKGTPFSVCVKGVAQMREEQEQEQEQEASS